jgi:hypothetical protein
MAQGQVLKYHVLLRSKGSAQDGEEQRDVDVHWPNLLAADATRRLAANLPQASSDTDQFCTPTGSRYIRFAQAASLWGANNCIRIGAAAHRANHTGDAGWRVGKKPTEHENEAMGASNCENLLPQLWPN